MKAAIYSRKSRLTDTGESIENQIQLCKEYAKSHFPGLDDFTIYQDEGFSGGNTNRPMFQKLLRDAKSKKFNVLICYRLDRISRNVADFSTTLETLQKYNIDFVSIKEQFDTSTPMGRAMIYIASVFAQLERETIAERIRDNMLELAKGGRWLGGQLPLGFDSERVSYLDHELNEKFLTVLIPNEKELKTVRLIFNLYLENFSIHKVLQYCLEHYIKGKNGGQLHSMSINDILRNPVYVKSTEEVFDYLSDLGMLVLGEPNGFGILTYNKKDVKGTTRDTKDWIAAVAKHEGVIEGSDWVKVQMALDKNKLKDNPRLGTSKKALLTGVLKCAHCGSPMRIVYNRPRKDGTKIYYYTCTMKAHSGKTRCDNPNVKGELLENAVINDIKSSSKQKIREHMKNLKKDNKKEDISQKIQIDLDQKTKQMSNLLEQLANATGPAAEFIMNKVNELSKDISTLKTKLSEKEIEKQIRETQKNNIELVTNALDEFLKYYDKIPDINNKRRLLETIITKITWDGNTNKIDITYAGAKQ
ncbi:recombinase family protein [Clostridium tunisiense]|uniref:recombinase family protein n=1 Tax=Clostridium tunisiense TaxID=219748 RepID=UPI00031A469B|nr:recombinase family protein [Clostridium tunisiense]